MVCSAAEAGLAFFSRDQRAKALVTHYRNELLFRGEGSSIYVFQRGLE